MHSSTHLWFSVVQGLAPLWVVPGRYPLTHCRSARYIVPMPPILRGVTWCPLGLIERCSKFIVGFSSAEMRY